MPYWKGSLEKGLERKKDRSEAEELNLYSVTSNVTRESSKDKGD